MTHRSPGARAGPGFDAKITCRISTINVLSIALIVNAATSFLENGEIASG